MKVYKATEADIDRRLKLDKRKTNEAFFRNFYESDSILPIGFYELQDKIRDGLEEEFAKEFDDGKDRSRLRPYQLATSYDFFSFPAEPVSSELILIEVSSEILSDRLIGVILSYLERSTSQYCVIATVYLGKEIIGSNYLGRFLVNLGEIAVEESLVEAWSRQVQFMGIENK
jgi:hypothetical protein